MLIDDEPAQSRLISALAARDGWRTIVAADSETAIAMLGTRQGMQLSAIILDQWVPGDDACHLIEELKSRRPALPILMLTTSASPLLAVDAMRAGATDYLIKPVAPDRLMEALRAATEEESPQDELQPLAEKMPADLDFDAMIGTAPRFRMQPLRVQRRRSGSLTPAAFQRAASNRCCSAMRPMRSLVHSTVRSARCNIAMAARWSSMIWTGSILICNRACSTHWKAELCAR